jgi:hypothetical protein
MSRSYTRESERTRRHDDTGTPRGSNRAASTCVDMTTGSKPAVCVVPAGRAAKCDRSTHILPMRGASHWPGAPPSEPPAEWVPQKPDLCMPHASWVMRRLDRLSSFAALASGVQGSAASALATATTSVCAASSSATA